MKKGLDKRNVVWYTSFSSMKHHSPKEGKEMGTTEWATQKEKELRKDEEA